MAQPINRSVQACLSLADVGSWPAAYNFAQPARVARSGSATAAADSGIAGSENVAETDDPAEPVAVCESQDGLFKLVQGLRERFHVFGGCRRPRSGALFRLIET